MKYLRMIRTKFDFVPIIALTIIRDAYRYPYEIGSFLSSIKPINLFNNIGPINKLQSAMNFNIPTP